MICVFLLLFCGIGFVSNIPLWSIFIREKEDRPTMNRTQLLIGCLVLCLAWGVENSVHGSGTCRFPAVYIFGDSNSDTGGAYAVFSAAQYPNGETFFGLLPGRFCDGRLILDFLSKN